MYYGTWAHFKFVRKRIRLYAQNWVVTKYLLNTTYVYIDEVLSRRRLNIKHLIKWLISKQKYYIQRVWSNNTPVWNIPFGAAFHDIYPKYMFMIHAVLCLVLYRWLSRIRFGITSFTGTEVVLRQHVCNSNTAGVIMLKYMMCGFIYTPVNNV